MTTSKVTVRQPTEQDAPRLAEIHLAAWRATYRSVMTDDYLDGMDAERAATAWRRSILTPPEGTVHLVAEDDDEVVGFAILGPGTGDSEPGTGQLYAINLHPAWWAKGIGSVLFAAAEHELIDLGYERAFLWVEKNNDRAITFYSNRGWLNDGATLEDTKFEPPVSGSRHSRSFIGAERSKAAESPRTANGTPG